MSFNNNLEKTDILVRNLPIGKEGFERYSYAFYVYKFGYRYEFQKAKNINLTNV
jgi:hypothetical protein